MTDTYTAALDADWKAYLEWARRDQEKRVMALAADLGSGPLADAARSELRNWDLGDDGMILYAGGELVVDRSYANGDIEVTDGFWTRTPEQQLHLALVHLAAALAAGAKL